MKEFIKKRELINWIGILGVISFISYFAAVVFSPLAYPGYNWLSQAVSDLTADGAPSAELWKVLAAFYGDCAIVCITVACIFVSKKDYNKFLKSGIYTFTIMNYISNIGYKLFPLSGPGNPGKFQDIMHIYVVTILVVLTSIAGLVLCIIGGIRQKGSRFIFISAIICLSFMTIGAIGTGAAPKAIFGIFERFSTLSATAFVGLVGLWMFLTPYKNEELETTI